MSSLAEHAARPGRSRARPRAVPSAQRRVLIRDAYGLHLRLADQIVHLAKRFRAEVRVAHRGRAADGKSILDMLGLAAAGGTRLDLEARGPDAEGAVAALTDLIATWSPEDLVAYAPAER
jgi:phosphocarrier protein HPr